MSARHDIDSFSDADPTLRYARRLLPSCVTPNVDTGELELIPQKAFRFNPDLSVHQELIVESLGSTIIQEYSAPPNGALYVPVEKLTSRGALLKATPHANEPILGAAHHSLYGESRTPSKTDKAAMRDLLVEHCTWIAVPDAA